MATKKISELNALTTPESDDLIAIVDASATETKKITYGNISKHIVNVGTEVEEDSRINFIHSRNLFNASIQAGTYDSTTYSVASDGLITQSASDSSNWNINQNRIFYLDAGTYTISIDVKTGAKGYMQLYNLTDSVDAVSTTSNSRTFTLNGRKALGFKTYGSGGTYPVSYYVMINEGSIALPYEENIPNQIVVDNEKYTDTLNVGTSVNGKSRVNVLKSKNLLPNNSSTITTNGITFTKNSDGSITINGTSTSRADLYIFGGSTDNGNYLKIKKGTYSFDRRNLTDGKIFVAFREKTAGTKYETLTNNGAIETMATQDCYIWGVMLGVESGNTINNLTIYPMLNEGNTLLPYEPYVTPSINVDGEEIYSKPVVLWTNSNTTSNFVGQTITLSDSLDNYSFYEISFYNSTSNTQAYSTSKIKNNMKTTLYYLAGLESGGNPMVRYRDITGITSTTITFGTPYYKQLNQTSITEGSNQTVPYQVIGYK